MSDSITDLIASLDSADKKVRKESIKKLIGAGKSGSVPLLNALGSNSEQVRAGAAEILGTYSEETIGTFLNLLKSGNENVRDGAARTMAQMSKNGINVLESLSELIENKNYKSRKGAALVIGYIGRTEKNIVNMLLFLLRDENCEVRKQAVNSLDQIKWNSTNQTERAYYLLVKEDWDSLRKCGGPSIPALSFGIEISDNEIKKKIASVLAKTDDMNSNSLLKLLLSDNDSGVRQAAVAAIADKGDKSLIPLLVQSMNDSNPNVRVEASWSLEKIKWRPDSYNEKAKSLMLRGNYKEVENMGETAIPCLIEFLGDDFYGTRESAFKILYSLGKPGIDAVKKASNNQNTAKYKGVYEALDYIRGEIVKEQEKKADDFLNGSKKSFELNSCEYWEEKLLSSGFGTEMAIRLSKSLSSVDPIIRIVTVDIFRKFGKISVNILILLTEDSNENVRIAAIEALGDLYAKDAVPCLLKSVEDENGNIRRASAYSLGKIRDTSTIPVLIRHFADPEENVRFESSLAVSKMGNSAIPFIENMAFHTNELVRISSLNALGEISDPYGIPLATRSLNDPDFDVRTEAMKALLKMSNFMFNYLMIEIHRVSIQGTKMEKLGMLSVLSKTDDMKIVPYVREFLGDKDEEIRRNAQTILDIFTEREIKKERGKIREYSRETAGLLRRKLSLEDLDRLLDRVINANDNDALEVLKKKLSPEEIDELIKNVKTQQKRDTSKLLGKKLTQDEIDELLHRSVYVENKNTTKLLCKKLSQDEIDDLIKRAGTEEDEKTAKDIKKQLTQNEIDNIIKKELELKKKIAMEVSRLIVGLKSGDELSGPDYSDKIVKMGEPAIEPLISTMNNADPEFQNVVADILIRTGKPGIMGMIRVLNYGRPDIKIIVAKKIVNSKDKEAFDALYDRIFSEKDSDVKKVLVESFGGLSDKRVFDVMVHYIKDKDPQVRFAALKILGRFKDERAIEPIILLFDDSNQNIRDMAVYVVKSYGKNAQYHLIKALKSDKKDSYKETAAKTLEDLKLVPNKKDDLVYYFIALNSWGEVIKTGQISISPLFELLKDPYSGKRIKALDSLIAINTERSIPPLSFLIFDMDEEISTKSRTAIMKMGGAALPQLKVISANVQEIYQKEVLDEIINEIEETERIKIFILENRWEELVKIGMPAVIYLSKLLSDKNPETRLNAIKTIGKTGLLESVNYLISALLNTDRQVSGIARAYLIKYGTVALPVLIETRINEKEAKKRSLLESIEKEIEQNERIKELILSGEWDALKREGLPALKALGVLMKSKSPELRLNCITVIAQMELEECIPYLANSFFDEDIRISDTAKKGLLKHQKKAVPILTHLEKITVDQERKDSVSALIKKIINQSDLE